MQKITHPEIVDFPRRNGDETEIIRLPNSWLDKAEREELQAKMFTPMELRKLGQIQLFNCQVLGQSDAIIVEFGDPDGFLGDIIQFTRLTGVLEAKYPGKVFENSPLPELLGKRPHLLRKFRTPRGYIYTVRRTLGEPELTTFAPTTASVYDNLLLIQSVKQFTDNEDHFIHKEVGINRVGFTQDTHRLHEAQVRWGILFDASLDSLPDPSISTSDPGQSASQRRVKQSSPSSQFNLVVNPDAHKMHFNDKDWPTTKWVKIFEKIYGDIPEAQVYITTGTSHPHKTIEIVESSKKRGLKVNQVPKVGLGEYSALLANFVVENTVFLGLESMAASHLAPSLGFTSIVIATRILNPKYYGPWGGLAVANLGRAHTVSIEGVYHALLATNQYQKSLQYK